MEALSGFVADPRFWPVAGVVLAAGFMRGFVGVGSGMLMAPVFAIFYGPLTTVGLVVLMESVVTAQLLPPVRRQIEWRVVVPMGVAAAACMPVGTWLLTVADAQVMARAIAAVVLVFSVVLLADWRYRGRRRPGVTLGVGAVSGVLMAATSLGNPPVMLYLLSGPDTAARNRANFTGYFAVTLLALIGQMVARGLIEGRTVTLAALLLPVFAAGAWAGARGFRRASETLYRRVALGLLACVGLYGLLR